MLTAAEAAARLGIKRATLYAYVSRGLVHRELADDGRTSLFDPAEIAALSGRNKAARAGELSAVIATAVTRVDDHHLSYRGRAVAELIDDDTPYEDVAMLLWDAPQAAEWPAPDCLAKVRAAQRALPTETSFVDRLRVSAAVASATDPLRHDLSAAAVHGAGRRLLSCAVDGLPDRGRKKHGQLADRLFAKLARKRANDDKRRALNAAMVALADHGLASSTLAVRVAASVRADPYSAVQAGLGVADGALHGAASGLVHELFENARGSGDAATAVGEARRRLGRIPGFGHSVYTEQDPRYGALLAKVTAAWSGDPRIAVVQRVRDVVQRRTDTIPNVDFALAALTFLAEMPSSAGEAIFVTSRSAGWLAHAIEEYAEAPLRFRPRARYVGR